MAYKRRYRRRVYKRARRLLSNRTVYGKTSAKSQARQIATLRNRVNYFARRNRPELKSKFSGSSAFTFDNSSASNTWKCYPGIVPEAGTGNDQRIGDYIRVKSLTWYFTFEYYHDLPGTSMNPDSKGGMIRVVLLQMKQPVSSLFITDRAHVLENWSDSGSAYTQQIITPLRTGITETFRVLADRKWTITDDKNQLVKKITVKPTNYRFMADGTLNNVLCMVVTSGLHWDSSAYTQYIKGTFSDKIVYTDA